MKAWHHPAMPQDTWRFGVARNDPGTLTIVSAAAAGLKAVGEISQGMAQASAARANAAIANRNAEVARQQAAADAEAKRREVYRIMGSMRANYGAAGITPEGSALDVLASSVALGELDVQNVLYKGRLREIGYQDTAAIETSNASSYITSSIFKAGSSLFEGASTYLTNQNELKKAEASREARLNGTG